MSYKPVSVMFWIAASGNCGELRGVLALFDGLQENKGPTGKNDSK